MRRVTRLAWAAGIFSAAVVLSASVAARAQSAPSASGVLPPLPASPAAPAASPPPVAIATAAPAPASSGLVVVALGGSMDVAWPLARAVYAQPSLRPSAVDEASARVLCGEAPAPDAPRAVRDLAETVAAIKGDDLPSRTLLAEIARRTGARAVVVVHPEAGRAVARVLLPDAGVFDAATYAPDAATPLTWNAAAQSLARAYGGSTTPAALAGAAPAPGAAGSTATTSAPPLATHAEPQLTTEPPRKRAFYESGWFWGALGAAAFAGGAAYFATRDNGASTIHLQMQVPH
jgi:hypothetical protein